MTCLLFPRPVFCGTILPGVSAIGRVHRPGLNESSDDPPPEGQTGRLEQIATIRGGSCQVNTLMVQRYHL